MRGVFHHNIDTKGRLNFPVKFREALGDHFIISRGLDDCLWAMTEEEFERIEEVISDLPAATAQKLQQYFAVNFDVETDAQGRILINGQLRQFAGLEKEVTLVGYKKRVEIWDTSCWKSANDITPSAALELLGDTKLF